MTMTDEAVKRVIAIAEEPDSDMPRYRFDQWQKVMFEALEGLESAVAAENARLRADAQAAVALVVERAADAIKACRGPITMNDHGVEWEESPTKGDYEAAIRALAPVDGLAMVEALRKERDDALDAAKQHDALRSATLATMRSVSADLAAAQAQIEALRGAGDLLEVACVKAIGQRKHPAWAAIRLWRTTASEAALAAAEGTKVLAVSAPSTRDDHIAALAADQAQIEALRNPEQHGYVKVIDVEKLLCEKLDIPWTATGISIASMIDRLAAANAREAELREAGKTFLGQCNSAWAAGEPPHKVREMLDGAETFAAALAALPAKEGE